jgi:recombination protein RecA
VGSRKRKRLEATVATIQRRWGLKALRRGKPVDATAKFPHIPTGFPSLDQALVGIGGIPRGRLTELLGAPTSGMVTLALKIIANAQANGDTAAYVDLGGTFDPDYAARCEVNLTRLLLVRPKTGPEALEIAQSLIAGRGVGVLVFEAVPQLLADPHGFRALATVLRQLPQFLAKSPCAPIFLTPLQFGDVMSTANYPNGFALPHYATVRLLLEKERWLQKGRDIRGYRARVLVLKNKLGAAGKSATISITFNGVVRGDST